jgi:hypothetical protein
MRAYRVHIYVAVDGEEEVCYFAYPPLAADVLRYLADHPGVGGVSSRCAALVQAHGLDYAQLTNICPYSVVAREDGFIEVNLIYVDKSEEAGRRDNRIRQLLEQRRVLVKEFKRIVREGDLLGHEIQTELGLLSSHVMELPTDEAIPCLPDGRSEDR